MRQVLAAAAAGAQVAETARALGLSESTVWTLRAAACARLHAPNVTAAVYLAVRSGALS